MKYSKALVAVVGAALTAALGTVPPDTQLFHVLTVVSALLTALGVYGVPNAEPAPKDEAGDVGLILLVYVTIIATLIFCGVHLHLH